MLQFLMLAKFAFFEEENKNIWVIQPSFEVQRDTLWCTPVFINLLIYF